MNAPRWPAALSPFAFRAYRFQWSADLLTSWAFEMETILLGWFIVVETESLLLVTLFGSMQFVGTLVAPFLGLMGDRIGQRNVMLLIRALFTAMAALGAALTFADMLNPVWVLVIAGLGGLVRPSDTGMRNVLIAETVPGGGLARAIPLSRITMDSARAAGALTGGLIVFVLGMKAAYLGVVLFYALGMALLLGVAAQKPAAAQADSRPSPFHEVWEGMKTVWRAPPQMAAMLMAFIVNVAAYPFTLGLLPYVARDIYGTTQVGLGYMVAAVAGGGVLGSVILTVLGQRVRPARMVFVWSLIWFGLVILFGRIESLGAGLVVLFVTGAAQMLCLMPMAVLLLRGTPAALRGRIMGLRTLAVYGLPLGLLCTGPLIERMGFSATAALYGLAGAAATLVILVFWRLHLWPRDAAANEG